jgi:hypothetical protein
LFRALLGNKCHDWDAIALTDHLSVTTKLSRNAGAESWGPALCRPILSRRARSCSLCSPPPRAPGHRSGRALPRRERGARDRAEPNIPARCRSRTQHDFAFNMQVYEASIRYSLVRVGNDEPLNTPTKIVEYRSQATLRLTKRPPLSL